MFRTLNRLMAWWVGLGYDKGTREVYRRIYYPTKQDVERYGADNILRARRELDNDTSFEIAKLRARRR